jgi:hypothetical protein
VDPNWISAGIAGTHNFRQNSVEEFDRTFDFSADPVMLATYVDAGGGSDRRNSCVIVPVYCRSLVFLVSWRRDEIRLDMPAGALNATYFDSLVG